MPLSLLSQTLASFRNVVPNGYNLWVYTPKDYDSTRAEKPLLLFLHGASLSGTDLQRVRKYGPLTAISYGHDIDAVILAPQSPGGGWAPAKVENVVNWALEHYAVDTNRIYVIGLSMGGYGTINYVATYPDRIAAAMALCGGGGVKDYCGLNTLPFWILHGTADKAVSINESQKVVNAMKACGPTPLLRFTKLSGQSHSALTKIFYLDETYEWLFSHRLNDNERFVNKDIDITVARMGTAYQNIDREKIKVTVIDGTAKKVEPVENPVVVKDAVVSDSTVAEEPKVQEPQEVQEIQEEQKVQEPQEEQKEQKATPAQTTAKAPEQTTAKAPEQTTASTSTPSYHIVKQGDTLYSIARRYNTTVENLCKINNIKENGLLQIDQKIKLK